MKLNKNSKTIEKSHNYRIVMNVPEAWHADNTYEVWAIKDGKERKIQKTFNTFDRARVYALEFIDFEARQDPMKRIGL